jgi:putative Ca2+/H+ antiporter (TMEM165/GDT1 family)
MHAFLLSFGVMLLGELGDRSQLMALAFATRYRAGIVLLATLLVHAGSVVLGVEHLDLRGMVHSICSTLAVP